MLASFHKLEMSKKLKCIRECDSCCRGSLVREGQVGQSPMTCVIRSFYIFAERKANGTYACLPSPKQTSRPFCCLAYTHNFHSRSKPSEQNKAKKTVNY